MSADHRLSMWTIYDHPLDYPEGYIARRWEVGVGTTTPTDTVMVADDVDKLREVLLTQMGLVRLERFEGDDPTILEVWL